MAASSKGKTIRLLFTLVVDAVLILAVVLLMHNIKSLLLEDVRLGLTEIGWQASEVINGHLQLEARELSLLARDMVGHDDILRQADVQQIRCEDWQKPLELHAGEDIGRLFIADASGRVAIPGQAPFSIKDRSYFRKALKGESTFSTRLILLHNGKPGMVLSVPLRYHDKIFGTLQKTFTPEQFYTMAVPSVFASKGIIDIISQQGSLLASSNDAGTDGNRENLFLSLAQGGNQEAVEKMENDLRLHRAGFVELVAEGEARFVVYMPIDAVPGWSMVFSVAQDTVFKHAILVMHIFYGILLTLVLFFAISLVLFSRMKRREQEKLKQVAFVDGVTGGNTYSKFMVDLEERLANKTDTTSYAILSFDIDSFKYVNSHYGFEVGDDILRLVDRSVSSKLTDDEMLGHVSGDRFVALVRNTSNDHLNDMLAPIDTPHGITLHFSGGLYHIRNKGESIKLMVDKATLASKEVKGKFRDFYALYSDELDQRLARAEELKQELQDALAKGEIIPYFQPKIDIDTGRLVGAEALARWRKPDGTLVPPGEFIPISEKTGLVVDIDKAILASVLKFIREQLAQGGCGATISSNFSRMHLIDIKFPQNVVSTLNEYGVPARYFEVELTESTFYSTNKRIADLVTTLRNAGVHVSMDDFGSGYSSLNMLKDIPIDVLKIDQGFLQQTNNVKRRDIIFAAVVNMAQELGIDVVVEGVETQEDVELMRRFSCHVAQGYYYAKPLSPEDFAVVYQQGHL